MENPDNKPKGRTAPANELTPNVAKVFIQWKSKNKAFSYYHKEKAEDVLLPAPFIFTPLAVCQTIKGYNQKKTKTLIANEVSSIEKEIFIVNSYNALTKEKKIEYKGLYKDIKDSLDQNIKFTQSVYAAIKNKKGEMSIVNIQLNGAGLHHWYDFIKKNNIWKGSIKVTKSTEEKNGDVDYFAPVYEITSIAEDDDIKCGELQNEVNEYLKGYFARNAEKQDSPAQETKKESTQRAKPTGKFEKDASEPEEPINFTIDDDDIPF